MTDEKKCDQVWAGGLKYGMLTECIKTNPKHWKHQNAEKTIQWWGRKLDAEEEVLRDALRQQVTS